MKAYSRKAFLLITDILLLNVAIYLALLIRFEGEIPTQYINVFLNTNIILTIFNIAIFYMFGLYTSLWTYASIDELMQVFIAAAIGSVGSYPIGLLLHIPLPRSVYIISFMLILLFVGGSRFSYRILRRAKRIIIPENDKVRVMIIGAGDAGSMVIREMQRHDGFSYMPVVVVDDDKAKHRAKIHGVPVKGDKSKIVELVEKYNVSEIIIAIPSASKQAKSEVIKICKQTKCKLKTLPGVYELINEEVSIKKIRSVSIEDILGREEVKLNNEEISSYINNDVILVTGGGGSIGSELCRQLARFQPKKLLILDIYENNAYDLQNELKYIYKDKLDFEVIIASVRDKARLREIFDKYKPSVVFHAAAHKHVPLMEANPVEAIKNNVFGTLNVAQCADEFGVKKFVLISTDKAVNPTNVMGATKRFAEMIIQSLDKQSKTEFVAVRFGNVLGSNGSVIPLFNKQIAQGGPVTVTHPEITRFFMTIPEAAQLVIQAGAMARGGEIFVLDMGECVKIDDLARDVIRLSGYIPDVDIKIEYTGLRPGEKLYEELLLAEEGIMATKHEYIFIAKPLDVSYKEMLAHIKSVEGCIDDVDNLKNCLSTVIGTYNYINHEVAVTK
ncbi:MAG TPA: nucleoside-diphosphate sugar epimerase/dehydratase [Patescibacteria group bacterium]|nr:nucleoside-diphosphate sugar epimerase/dehydratase [Patescibacteria group bacterium]